MKSQETNISHCRTLCRIPHRMQYRKDSRNVGSCSPFYHFSLFELGSVDVYLDKRPPMLAPRTDHRSEQGTLDVSAWSVRIVFSFSVHLINNPFIIAESGHDI